MTHEPNELQTVAVIGAGFSGTVVAAHLLSAEWPGPLRVVLINRSGPLARGVAFGTTSSRHVLNVPAGRMSAFANDEDDFVRFARERDASVTGGTFAPRRLYGEYLSFILDRARSRAAAGVSLTHIAAEAISIAPSPDGARAVVGLNDGEHLVADRVVLAQGNYAPVDPPSADKAVLDSPRYIRDPWQGSGDALSRVSDDGPVLLYGTGLTMLDVALDVAHVASNAPLIALSRRGLTPISHRPNTAPPAYAHLPPELVACAPTTAAYLRAVRRHVRHVASAGVDWRDVIASLRPVTPRLWEALPLAERARFLRHVRPYWEVHRHRAAPELVAQMEQLRGQGRLSILAARIISMRLSDKGIEVEMRRRGGPDSERMTVASVVNCTGPNGDLRSMADPLISDLRRRGLIRPDPLGLGVDVSDGYSAIDANGRSSHILYVTGPLLRARWWEATAVPELRGHAARVAQAISGQLGRERQRSIA